MLLSKRRAQLKQAVGAMVKEAMTFVDKAPNLEVKTKLIETLNDVTAGKIFVEVEKARLTRALAKIKEEAGLTNEAAEIMQEVAVETYGALSKHEKLFFIEEQVRLCLDKGDTVRAQILSRKINPRSFDEIVKAEKKAAIEAARKAGEDVSQMDLDAGTPKSEKEKEAEEKKKNASVEHAEGYFEATDPTIPSVPELKLRYYQLMIRFHSHSDDYLESVPVLPERHGVRPGSRRRGGARKLQARGAEKSSCGTSPSPRTRPCSRSLLHSDQQGHAPDRTSRCTSSSRSSSRRRRSSTGTSAAGGVRRGDGGARRSIFGGREARGDEARRLEAARHRAQPPRRSGRTTSRVTLDSPRRAAVSGRGRRRRSSCRTWWWRRRCRRASTGRAGVVDFNPDSRGADWLLNQWVGKVDKLLDVLDKSNHLIHKEAMAHKVSLE